MAAVGTHDFTKPVSRRCFRYSKPKKKKTLFRSLLKSVPGMSSGPLKVPPGYRNLFLTRSLPILFANQSFELRW